MEKNNKYSIVLVIKETTHHNGVEHNNLERFMQIGMMTYEKYLDKESIEDFFIIAPASDVKSIQTKLTAKYPNWPWKFVVEDAIVSKNLPSGWAKQQTAKFAIAQLVKTSHYLIIDDDTYLTKPFSYNNLFHNGKCILNKCQIDFPFFFFWSSQIAKADYDMVQYAPYHMAITPEAFVTQRVKDLVKWLEGEYGDRMQWQLHLANNKFTEYCTYWIYLMKLGVHTQEYACEDDAPCLYNYATTGPEHNLALQVKKSFIDNKNHFFSFVQTSLPITNKQVLAEVRKYVA